MLADQVRIREDGAAISERASESGRDSTPQGTIHDFHDIRSEQHQYGNFQKNRAAPFDINRGGSSSGKNSVEATRSVMSKQTNVAVVSQKVILKETNSAQLAFE
jgi:hypothetical protein